MISNQGCKTCKNMFSITDSFCETGIISHAEYEYFLNNAKHLKEIPLLFVIEYFGRTIEHQNANYRNYKKEYEIIDKTFCKLQPFVQTIGTVFITNKLHMRNNRIINIFIKHLDNLHFYYTTNNIKKKYNILDFFDNNQLCHMIHYKNIYNKINDSNSKKYKKKIYQIIIKFLYIRTIIITDIANNIYKYMR